MNKIADMQQLESKAAELAEKYHVDMIVLFGSRPDGTSTVKSDVDIAYTKNKALSFEDQLSLGSELAPLFGTEAVDVVYLNTASPAFMYQIMKKARLLFSRDPDSFPNLFSYSVKRLHENMPLYNLKFDRLCKEYGVK